VKGVRDEPLGSTATLVALVLVSLGLGAAVIATLPRALSPAAIPAGLILADVAPWVAIVLVWLASTRLATRSAQALWALPSRLFRTAILVGGTAVLAAESTVAASEAARGVATRTLVATTTEDVLYGLGVVALGALASFALSRTLLRPALRERASPVSPQDITLRTRFLVASTGASFATAGVLLDVLVDFERTSDATLVGYVLTATALVGFAAAIGWLVGDDTARGIESVASRMRDLASRGSASSAVPLYSADEIGELAAAATELERRVRREDAAAATSAERERIARELHDGIAKSLSILALEAATVAAKVPAEMRPELARIERLSRLLSEELRAIVSDARSRDSGERLDDSLRHSATRYPGARVELSGDLDRIGALARFEILRIVEEGFRNAVRHAEANAIVARVAVSDGRVRLEVEDDGRGVGDLDWDGLARQGRYGLIGMRERAALLRGALNVERGIERGTIVRVEFPVTAE